MNFELDFETIVGGVLVGAIAAFIVWALELVVSPIEIALGGPGTQFPGSTI